jgi:hypothetical protein
MPNSRSERPMVSWGKHLDIAPLAEPAQAAFARRVYELRGMIRDCLKAVPAGALDVLRTDAIELGPVEDALRHAIREVRRLRSETRDPRPERDSWWECEDCRAKLAGITGQTITIVRKDLTVYVARTENAVVVIDCPRCKREQQFVR